jgi:F-type H+-transporting ATPase subunit b
MRIDWLTLALQTANVLILIWLLARFLFRPIAEIVARRQAEANRLLSEAAAAQRQAAEARDGFAQARASLAAEHDMVIGDARAAAKLERDALLAGAAKEIERLRMAAAAQIADERAAMEHTLIDRARELSIAIARRLLGRVAGDASAGIFLSGLCEQLRALSERERAALVSAPDPLEVVTSTPLSKDAKARIETALAAALGAPPALVFRDDPAVLAGIELHNPHAVIGNSWRGDLDRMDRELKDR